MISITPPPSAFLPRNLDAYLEIDATNTRGGVITAWDSTAFTATSSLSQRHSLTIFLRSTASDYSFAVTNVYAPSNRNDSPAFLADLRALATHIPGCWLLAGDFNLTRSAADNSNGSFHSSLGDAFNVTIDHLSLIDLPLLDRLYTWSNHRQTPTLARLDRVLFNATQRLRKNNIRELQVDGTLISSHAGKTAALTAHLRSLLRAVPTSTHPVTYDDLYATSRRVDAAKLITPFTEEEARAAVHAMNGHSSPGLDGFGPTFYKAAWATVAPAVMALAAAFHGGSAELERLNRAYVVLIPKHATAATPGDYRPICLQNCSIKILSKMMTTRLQGQIASLIDLNQTGFIKGRSISENFIYAMELIQCCHRRKLPTLVLKLDFAKAFDSVDWHCLLSIMATRGFPQQWNTWVSTLLHTSKLAVLVNGTPGPWFTCGRGLRQGDPLSPYLFLLVADVLQQMVKQNRRIQHPVDATLPCPILQYADDTLILLKADAAGLQTLKEVLNLFSDSTGLHINYHKSTMVPMGITDETATQLQGILGCQLGSFPQTYLGLPLSNDKLRLSAFSPLIAKIDKRLSGWSASLLNSTGRTVLINSVVDSQLTHAMSTLLLPQGLIEIIDRRRRRFLWAGEDKVSGAQCLVAWEAACQPKAQGGLSLKNLPLQNRSLLLKHIHRLHHPAGSSWALWVRGQVNISNLQGDILGTHWRDLETLLPIYRALTCSVVSNGASTNFWLDRWLPDGRLSDLFPLLISHATNTQLSVKQAMTDSLQRYLAPRLSRRAADELSELESLLAQVVLREGADLRSSPLASDPSGLGARDVYSKLMETAGSPAPPFVKFVWINRAPPRVKFFTWLLVQERIHCRANLKKKKILTEASCELCGLEETCDHIIFHCSFATSIWSSLEIDTSASSVTSLWTVPHPTIAPGKHYSTFLILLCWSLWKHRNEVVFQRAPASSQRFWTTCCTEARLWRERFKPSDRAAADAWCSVFCSM
ncbi:uncharacterized protein LOC101781465 [Setaria italica]|uniref:uncharacterized protein LOC101781465 n=1 Tax=Setaria italica TaxID=4555 RepID=UPI000350F330|nr:uncharacterized protein LOC101781465 [Setaria italica]